MPLPALVKEAGGLQTPRRPRLCAQAPGGARAQLAHPLLLRSAPGHASIVMMGSVAGGPTSLKSGTVYAMTKGARAPGARPPACMPAPSTSAGASASTAERPARALCA